MYLSISTLGGGRGLSRGPAALEGWAVAHSGRRDACREPVRYLWFFRKRCNCGENECLETVPVSIWRAKVAFKN